jgi:hypothetical protein
LTRYVIDDTKFIPNLGKGLYPEEYDSPPLSSITNDTETRLKGSITHLNFAVDKPVRILVSNDYHAPYHDKKALGILLKFIEWYQPDYHILAGDIWDFYQLSSFNQNPKFKANLQSDLNIGKQIIKEQQKASPKTKYIFIPGNHEERLQRFIWRNADVLNLDCLELENVLGLDEMNIRTAPPDEGLMINDVFMVYHGSLVRKFSGWTAKAEYEKNGCCGMSGHCHRGGDHRRTNRGGDWGWWENYCLCRLDPEYIKHPDWQQGFRAVTFFGQREFRVADMAIINNKAYYGEVEFNGN